MGEKESEEAQTKVEQLNSQIFSLKNQIRSFQNTSGKEATATDDLKTEHAQLSADHASAMDRLAELQRDLHKAETEKKDGLVKIQSMNNEIKELKRNLEEFEANESSEIRNLEQSLTKASVHTKLLPNILRAKR